MAGLGLGNIHKENDRVCKGTWVKEWEGRDDGQCCLATLALDVTRCVVFLSRLTCLSSCSLGYNMKVFLFTYTMLIDIKWGNIGGVLVYLW